MVQWSTKWTPWWNMVEACGSMWIQAGFGGPGRSCVPMVRIGSTNSWSWISIECDGKGTNWQICPEQRCRTLFHSSRAPLGLLLFHIHAHIVQNNDCNFYEEGNTIKETSSFDTKVLLQPYTSNRRQASKGNNERTSRKGTSSSMGAQVSRGRQQVRSRIHQIISNLDPDEFWCQRSMSLKYPGSTRWT
jgi:hypothetical protein